MQVNTTVCIQHNPNIYRRAFTRNMDNRIHLPEFPVAIALILMRVPCVEHCPKILMM